MVDAVVLVAVEGVFEGVDVGDVDAGESPGDELVELVGGVRVQVDEGSEWEVNGVMGAREDLVEVFDGAGGRCQGGGSGCARVAGCLTTSLSFLYTRASLSRQWLVCALARDIKVLLIGRAGHACDLVD
jgi:hypothetical protein